MDKVKVWVSLTTIPSRLGDLEKTLQSIINQTRKPDRINLCLPAICKKESTSYIIPESISENPNINIVRCSEDWGPGTKLLGSLEICTDPDTLIITVDDDIIYHPTIVEKLIERHLMFPDCAVGFCGWNCEDVKVSVSYFYQHLIYEDRIPNVAFATEVNILEGYRGVLTKRSFWTQDVFDYKGSPEGAFYVDDVWLNGHLALNNVPRLSFRFDIFGAINGAIAYGQIWVHNSDKPKNENNSLSTMGKFYEYNRDTAIYFETRRDDIWRMKGRLDRDDLSHVTKAKIGIVIPVHNRPEFFRVTLQSLMGSNLQDCSIVLVDDASTNVLAKDLVRYFKLPIPTARVFNKTNQGVAGTLKLGLEKLKDAGCEFFCILDSDTIVTPDWISRLRETFNETGALVTGFNITNRTHHVITKKHPTYNVRKTVGGVNLFFNRKLLELILPCLINVRWDYRVCTMMHVKNRSIVSCFPSCVQHIGFKGMNSSGFHEFDFSHDFSVYAGNDYYMLPLVASLGEETMKPLDAPSTESRYVAFSNEGHWTEIPDVSKWILSPNLSGVRIERKAFQQFIQKLHEKQ